MRKRKREGEERERKKKEKEKWVFRFSLRSMEIGPSIFVGVRGKVGPRNEGYAWVLKSGSFVKLQEVGNFPNWNIFSLKACNGIGCLQGCHRPCDLVPRFWD